MPNLTHQYTRMLSLLSTLVVAVACGDDKGGTDGSSSATATDTAGTDSPTTTPTTTPTSGDPTADPTAGPVGSFCQEECSVDADCMTGGVDIGLTCAAGRCTSDAGKCTGDMDCQVQLSGWLTTCASQAECPGQVCVDIGGGEGRCATPPSDFIMCETLNQVEIQATPIEGGADVTVCANTDYTCKDSLCQNPCESDTDCSMLAGHPKCDTGTGACQCASDDDCKATNSPAASVCHDGYCGCGKDADCVGTANADVCTASGFCGCSDATVCTTKVFEGTKLVCEGF